MPDRRIHAQSQRAFWAISRPFAVMLLCAFSINVLRGADILLPSNSETWSKRLPDLEGTAEIQNGVLHIGPYRSGKFMLRLENRKPLTILNGMVEGEYRTSGLVPGLAAVQETFTFNKSRVFPQATFRLSNPAAWTRFQFPIRRAPPTADAVTLGFGLGDKTEGFLEVRNVRVSDRRYPLSFPADPGPLTRQSPPQKLTPAKFWHLQNVEGAWWLVSPEGKPFFSLGTRPPASPEGVAKLRELGFNTVSGGATPSTWIGINDKFVSHGQPYIPQFATVFTNGSGKNYDIVQDGKGQHPPPEHVFPDVFDPRWEPAFRATVHNIASRIHGKPYLIAWFLDNERHHRDLPRFLYAPSSASALRGFLQQKYGSIGALNSAWGSRYSSFDDLIASKPDPGSANSAMYSAYHDFARLLVKRYVDTEVRIIHEEDPGRLVFSNRFMLGEIEDFFDYLDAYSSCDGIAVNLYPSNIDAGLSQTERDILAETYRRTHKPIIISEWSVPSLDSGFYTDPAKSSGSYAAAVDTQQDRARQAAKVTVDYYNSPYVVGEHWFTWDEFNDPGGKPSNRGLFRSDGQPWQMLQDALRSVNDKIIAAYSGRK